MSTGKPQIARTLDDYTEELSWVFETAQKSSTKTTYYFETRESNPLKNVIVNYIINTSTLYHSHEFYEVNYVASGSLHQNISGRFFSLEQGELLIMSPGVSHACIPSANSHCLNLLFKKEFIKRLAEDFKQYDPNNFLSSLTEKSIYTVISAGKLKNELTDIVLGIHKMSSTLIHHVDLYENLTFENAATGFLLYLTKFPRHEYNYKTGHTVQKQSVSPDEIVNYISNNFDKITLTDTALHFGYSNCQLHRIIKKHAGVTFSELILNIRMQRARHYLLNTHLPISSIAHLLGLDSVEHFSRMFKKHRKMTPTEYRNSFMRTSLQNKQKNKK